jgi:hypothetical protein
MRWPNTSNCWPILNIQMMCSQDEFAWAKSQQINDRWFYHSRDAEQMKLFLEQRECSSIEASNGQFLKRIRCNVGRRWQLSTKRKVSTRVLRTLGLSRFEETCCTELRNNRHIRQTTKKKIVSRQIGKEKLHTSKESCVMVKLTKNLCWKKAQLSFKSGCECSSGDFATSALECRDIPEQIHRSCKGVLASQNL